MYVLSLIKAVQKSEYNTAHKIVIINLFYSIVIIKTVNFLTTVLF